MASILIFEPKTEGHHLVYLRLVYEALSGSFERVTICANFTSDISKRELIPYLGRGVVRENVAHLSVTDARVFALKLSEEYDYLFVPFLDDCLGSLALWSLTISNQRKPKIGGFLMIERCPDITIRNLKFSQISSMVKWFVVRALLRVGLPSRKVAPILCNQDATAHLLKRSIPQMFRRSEIIYDPWISLPNESRELVRLRYGVPLNAYVYLHIGSSRPSKGFIDLLDAFEALVERRAEEPFYLLRVGDNSGFSGSTKRRLRRLVGVGRAGVVDKHISTENFGNVIGCVDCVVLPYKSQSGPSGVLSAAIGASLGVVASDCGFLGWAVREWNCGLLFEHENLDSLITALSLFYDEKRDYDDNEALHASLSPAHFVNRIHQVYAAELNT
jgi:glycosyltransferase involved in cell wall biosynthesis